ncbi:transcription elongation factor spt5 [Malassezia caprae]|uniref:Transcription elongation factor SPT5 n=1 Tax=Malassezia caprae TaxID=1381934 RepID=A0AAF0EAJ4_9BASI|nr:transcription elongation factor spt5 [Malassezia caprae]
MEANEHGDLPAHATGAIHEGAPSDSGSQVPEAPPAAEGAAPVADVKEEEDDEEDGPEEEDEEDEEEEDDEEDDEEEEGGRRSKKPRRNRFLDVEAEVDSDDEDVEDEEAEELLREDGFIADDLLDEFREAQLRTAADNQRLDRFRRQEEEMSAEVLAEELRQRHARSSRYSSQSDYADVPQRLLMPSVDDPGLWRIRCKRGREKHLVATVLRRALTREAQGQPLRIYSAFCRDSLDGQLFVEARRADDVLDAFQGLAGVYTGQTRPFLVPILEMADLLKLQKKNTEVPVGGWVRIKRGKYAGDLAQVLDVTENGEEVGVKLVPRIDMAPGERDTYTDRAGRKRKKPVNAALTSLGFRPPPRLFNAEEVQKVYPHEYPTKRGGVWVFGGETFRDGYLEKDMKMSALQIDDVHPSLDEVLQFTGETPAEGAGVDLNLLADASKRGLEATLQPGDHVEVFEGEQAGVVGVVEAMSGDVVTLDVPEGALAGQKIEVPATCVRKQFRAGDHIKVLAGKHADETGLVVKVEDGVTTFLSDLSLKEVSVFSKDIREAAEVGSGVNVIGGYELHNLVQLDAQTVGVIFKIERESFKVLDQNGHVVTVQPHQISMRRDTARAVALDHNGHEVHVGDMVKEVEWPLSQFRQGQVLHIVHSTLLFVHNRAYAEHGGLFLVRASYVEPLAPTSVRPKTDLSQMNPALRALDADGGANASGPRRGGRDIFVGKSVAIVRGPYKTYRGIIKETTGGMARVELHTTSKILTVPLDHMVEKNPVTGESRRLVGPGPAAPNPYASAPAGGMTPAYGGMGGKTPAYMGGGMTPAYGGFGQTPNPYASATPNPYGARTPAYAAFGQTPNPYASATPNPYGGRTPGYPMGQTPNPYASATPNPYGGRTPAYPVGQTPNPYASTTPNPYASTTPNPYGGRTPAHASATPNPYGAPSHPNPWGAPPAAPAVPLMEGMRVRVGRDAQGTSYQRGAYDGSTGRVLTRNPAVAKIELETGAQLSDVPVACLEPLRPSAVGDRCIVTDGAMRGSQVTIEQLHNELAECDWGDGTHQQVPLSLLALA